MYNHTYDHENRHNFVSQGNKPSKTDHDFFDVTHIVGNLYIGDRNISLNKSHLQKLNIKHIIAAG